MTERGDTAALVSRAQTRTARYQRVAAAIEVRRLERRRRAVILVIWAALSTVGVIVTALVRGAFDPLELVFFTSLVGTLAFAGFSGVLLALGAGMTLKGFWRFPSLGQPAMTSVLELMMDPYASPLKGRPVAVQGTLIGRADAGSYIAEDMMMEDPQGGLMTLNYEHWLPLFGNAWFGWKTVTRLVGQPFQAVGWFRRGIGQQVDLDELRTQGETVSSYTGMWGRMGGVLVSLIGVVVLGAAMIMVLVPDPAPTPTGTTAPTVELPSSGGK